MYTNHRSITHFLALDLHEGIYEHWANKLRRLNIIIRYVSGHRNKVADGLSRILFDSPDYFETFTVAKIKQKLDASNS